MTLKFNPEVSKVQKVVVSPATYTMTLTPEEAGVIATLLGNVAGTGKFRGIVNKLWNDNFEKLMETEYYYNDVDFDIKAPKD